MTEPNNQNDDVQRTWLACVLSVLRDHTVLPHEEFEIACKDALKVYGDSIDIAPLLLKARREQLVTTGQTTISLTAAGDAWLNSNSAEAGVESDLQDVVEGTPKRPYDVAKLKMEARQVSIFQALRKIEKDEIDLNPEFQRAFVWDVVKQSRLIESILIRIPLPAFYLDATDQVRWSVVDGLQRLTTMFKYCRKESFALTGLQFLVDLNGKTFSELPAQYRVLVEDDTQLLFYNLMPGTPVEAKFTIFSRVNTGGMQLTPQEIRHALNQGPVTEWLAGLAKEQMFLRTTSGAVESLRMSDRELILRAIAFMHFGTDTYKDFNELDGFLLHAMATLNKASPVVLEQLRQEFLESLSKVHGLFGRYSFRKFTERNGRRSPFNKALFETWVSAVRGFDKADLLRNKERIIDSFISLNNYSMTFIRSISSSTANYSAVVHRSSALVKLLQEACGVN